MTWYNEAVPQVMWPEGANEGARITHFTLTPAEAQVEALRAAFSVSHRGVPAGTYCRLHTKVNGGWWLQMSDTPDERRDCVGFVWDARGRVLVTGLGLGVVVNALLLHKAVEHVTVLEINPYVVDLVVPHLVARHDASRLTVRVADALTYQPQPGERYDWAWHDIWPDICSSNKPEYVALFRRWSRRVPAGQQAAWAKEMVYDR